MLLPAALACADRVNVSAHQWQTMLRRRWDGRVLLLRPKQAGGLFDAARRHGGEHPAFEAFFAASEASATCALA